MDTLKRKNRNDGVHIYQVSRLFRKLPTTWLSFLREMDRDREFMRSAYAPLRAAILIEHRKPGKGAQILERRLNELAAMPNFETIQRVSRHLFAYFRDNLIEDIAEIEEDFVNYGGGTIICPFGAHKITGGFHARARTKKGLTIYIYLHPSDWDDDQRTAFIELLAVLAESQGGSRKDVWFVDLKRGTIEHPPISYKNLRKELGATLDLLAKIRKAA